MIGQRFVEQRLELVAELLAYGFSLLPACRSPLRHARLNAVLAAWPLFIRQITSPIDRSAMQSSRTIPQFLARSREPYAPGGVWFLNIRTIAQHIQDPTQR